LFGKPDHKQLQNYSYNHVYDRSVKREFCLELIYLIYWLFRLGSIHAVLHFATFGD